MAVPRLRNYQERDVGNLRRAFSKARRVLYVSPTGSGKTTSFAFMAQSASAKGLSVAVYAHRRELVFQASERFDEFGIPHGLIMSGQPMNKIPVQIGMIQTSVKRIGRLREPDFVVVDEAHHATSSTYTAVMDAFPKAKILGVTATPQRLDGRGLGEVFEEIVIGSTTGDLIELDYLSKYRLFCPPQQFSLSGVKTTAGDFNRGQLAKEIDRSVVTGDAVDHYKKHGLGLSVAFCVSVEHAEHVASDFNASGVPAASIDGSMSSGDRSSILARFEAGEIRVLTSCDLVSEGFDLPAVDGALLLRPTKSLSLYLQQVGRTLRPAPGKEKAIILDHAGNALRHGLPDDDREWSLEGRKKGERQREDFGIAIRRCKQCFAVYKAGQIKCPNCGVEAKQSRKLESRNGDLVEVTPEMERRGWLRTAVYDEALAACQSPADIREMGEARGYKRGWIIYQSQLRFGLDRHQAMVELYGVGFAMKAKQHGWYNKTKEPDHDHHAQ